jgi:D-amino-acid oxidase
MIAADTVVIGGGVVGLSTAIRLAEAGYAVRILTRERSPHTTSDVAGAVWYPFQVGPADKVVAWGRVTFEVLRELVSEAATGVSMVPGLELFPAAAEDRPTWAAGVDHFRKARADELPPDYADGYVFAVPTVAMTQYLAWLTGRLLGLGGTIETRTVHDVDALLAEVPVVVNCTGLGARELVGDRELFPIRGQVVRVAPGFADTFVQAGSGPHALAYIIPRHDCTVLGGTKEDGVWDLTIDPDVTAGILARCQALVPALADAPILSEAVGLRPGRPEVRLEAERRPGGLVVHNYGHGGSGVTLSWGCAAEAVRLVTAHAPGPPTPASHNEDGP